MAVTIENGYIKMTAAADTYAGKVEPSFYRWHSVGSAGDQCILNDGCGRELFHAKVEIADGEAMKPHPKARRYAVDLSLPTMTSGILEVHFKSLGL